MGTAHNKCVRSKPKKENPDIMLALDKPKKSSRKMRAVNLNQEENLSKLNDSWSCSGCRNLDKYNNCSRVPKGIEVSSTGKCLNKW